MDKDNSPLQENFDFEHSEDDLIEFLYTVSTGKLADDRAISRFFGYGEEGYDESMRDDIALLVRYAKSKLAAMDAREHGNIPLAITLESRCDAFYNALNHSARW